MSLAATVQSQNGATASFRLQNRRESKRVRERERESERERAVGGGEANRTSATLCMF